MLQLNAKIFCVNGTQTDPFGNDSNETGKHSIECQTSEQWNSQRGKFFL